MKDKLLRTLSYTLLFIAVLLPALSSAAVIYDQLDLEDRDGYWVSTSRVNKSEISSLFSISTDVTVQSISWTGILFANDFIDKDNFVIRVYDDNNGLPNSLLFEEAVTASKDVFNSQNSYDMNIFNTNLSTPLLLSEGDFWLSILLPETSPMVFHWAVEALSYDGTGYGNGGALKLPYGDTWESGFPGIPAAEAAGNSFLLESAIIPIPTAAWLFSTGLVGLIGVARRKKS